ncbi:MAG TPA: tetratricopeptide repeat protein [Iamia sp.]
MTDGPEADDDHGQALALATQLHGAGESARALELLPDLVAARPDDVEVRLLLARCLATSGAPAVALAAAEAAAECDPTSWEAQILVARAAVSTDPDGALAAAERAVQLAPAEPDAVLTHSAVRAARDAAATAADTPRKGAGGLGATLGLRRPGPTETTTTALPEAPPRLEPRLPTALDPRGLDDADLDAPGAPAEEREPPPLPVSLGGTGLPAADRSTTPGADQPGSVRTAVRVIGLVAWLVLAFRIGAQGIGGPVGIGLFVVVAAGVAYATRYVRTV